MSSGRLFRALAQQSQMNGLRQLRDVTGAHQVGWRSPTVDDDETASQQHGEESQTALRSWRKTAKQPATVR